jgi:hypothetical protein
MQTDYKHGNTNLVSPPTNIITGDENGKDKASM